jgi:NADPH:quinone reductase-like Zn-dependent oxidoreductase
VKVSIRVALASACGSSGAQSYRPFGTAAQLTVVPNRQAVTLPDGVSEAIGACLGIPGITAHRAVFADGPVAGLAVLVHAVLGGVGALAGQLVPGGDATVIGTVRKHADLARVNTVAVAHSVALDEGDPAAAGRWSGHHPWEPARRRHRPPRARFRSDASARVPVRGAPAADERE